jgi:hypothetical protein
MGSVGVARALEPEVGRTRGGEATRCHLKKSTRLRDRARGAEGARVEVMCSEDHTVLQLLRTAGERRDNAH